MLKIMIILNKYISLLVIVQMNGYAIKKTYVHLLLYL